MADAGERRRRPDGGRRARGPDPDDPDAGVPERGPRFFLAVFQGGIREARVYRAYPDEKGVSFVYAGPAVQFLDLDIARRPSRGGWKEAAEAVKGGLISAACAAVGVAAIVIVIAGRLAIKDQTNVTDLIGMLLAFAAIIAIAAVVALAGGVRRITQRVAVLEAMSPEEIRKEAKSEKRSFRVTAGNVEDVRIDPHDEAGGGRSGSAARLSFRHDPTGKWKLSLLSRKDARAAARAFRHLLGEDGVEVNLSL